MSTICGQLHRPVLTTRFAASTRYLGVNFHLIAMTSIFKQDPRSRYSRCPQLEGKPKDTTGWIHFEDKCRPEKWKDFIKLGEPEGRLDARRGDSRGCHKTRFSVTDTPAGE